MIIGIGIDMVKSSRVAAIRSRWGDRFLHRIFTLCERNDSLQRRESDLALAARFAVKEAVLKALGIGLRMGVKWQEIETTRDPFGKPTVHLSGKTQTIARDKQVIAVFASISHEDEYAIAQIILTGGSGQHG